MRYWIPYIIPHICCHIFLHCYQIVILSYALGSESFAGIVFVGAYLDFMRNNGPYLNSQLVLVIGRDGQA
jgi:hypothetical protein